MTYRYACDAGHEFEAEQRIADAPLERCAQPVREDAGTFRDSAALESCGAPCRRLISGGSGFILKGGRWAAGGYAK